MHARVVTYKFTPDQASKVVGFYHEVGVPGEKASPGRKAGYLLIDRKGGKALTISIWASAAEMQASDAGNRARQATAGHETGVHIVSQEQFEIFEGK